MLKISNRPLALMRRQRGMSFSGWLLVLAGLIGAITLGLKMVPHYVENRAIESVILSMEPAFVRTKSKKDVHALIDKRLRINNVREYRSADIVNIKRIKDRASLVLDYEVRENVVANADVVLVFQKEFRL